VAIGQEQALAAILTDHRALLERVGARAAAVVGAVADGEAYRPPASQLASTVTGEVLPQALAEEQSIYPAAAASGPALAATVESMIAEHRDLGAAARRLAHARGGPAAAELAELIAAAFAAHVAKENTVLLPALIADQRVDVAALLGEMHRLAQAARRSPPVEEDLTAG
jgi:iron-sulfur cluster repair protein YtfE (RIC family)